MTVPAQANEPSGFACTFESGSSQAYADGVFTATPAERLQFNITNIDLDRRTAVLSTTSGKGSLRIVRAIGANHFLEAVTEGYLNTTTIYALDPKRKAHPAVHSRHVGLFGEPLVAQYVGFCTASSSAATPPARNKPSTE